VETSVSLLERLRTQPNEALWQRLDDLYRPLIRCWLLRDPALRDVVDDLAQEVMAALVTALPAFHRERPGSFRRWLRQIAVNRLKGYWRSRRHRPNLLAGPTADSALAKLEDPASELSQQWDQEHDQHVLRRLLELIEPEFPPVSWQAFRRVVFDDARPAEVAAELGIAVSAVYVVKSRILKRLREEGRGLVD
jgi:RNA polymerase sigma-70 factor (ECF subfamily)